MALFRRQPRDAAAAVDLPGLSRAESQGFMADLAAALDARGGGWSVAGDTLRLEDSTKEYGLTSIAQRWRQTMPTHRRSMLFDRLAAIDAPRGRAPEDAPAAPGIAAAEMLALARPQLWAMADVERRGDDLVAREVADDLAVVLSLDLPAAVQPVPPADIAGAGVTEDELWERAVAQLDDGELVEMAPLDDDECVVILTSDSHFLATRLLALEELVGTVPPHGALVAVPHRHMLVVTGIEDATVVDAMALMAPFAAEQFAEGPGALSPHLYWWRHDGELERLVVDDDEGSITPPDSFAALLETLT